TTSALRAPVTVRASTTPQPVLNQPRTVSIIAESTDGVASRPPSAANHDGRHPIPSPVRKA
ncbi:MAG TPA: hypothetical protein VFG33_26740, partial [Kribbella sp.]|uniref:hypothetical protein n=1 Tax=Kribbella sp. TaxID=1871183 RepID=UPI002D782407